MVASASQPEYLALRFITHLTAENLTSEILSGNFRVGMHVQGMAGDGSESVVTTPEPTTLIAGALLLCPLGLSAVRNLRRFARRS